MAIIISYLFKTLCYRNFSDSLLFPISSSKYRYQNLTVQQPLSTCGLSVARQQLSSLLTSHCFSFDEGQLFVQKFNKLLPNHMVSHLKRQSCSHSKGGRHNKFLTMKYTKFSRRSIFMLRFCVLRIAKT